MKAVMAVCVLVISWGAGCDNSAGANRSQDAEYERQMKQSAKFLEEGDRQLDEYDKQLAQMKRQSQRYDALLEQWEKQARRFDAILDQWEQVIPVKGRDSSGVD